MIYNNITLAFPEKEEKLFLNQYYFDSLFQVRVSFILVTFLYAIFGFLDTMLFPEFASVFHAIRYFVVVPLLTVVFLLSYTKIFRRVWQELLLLCFIAGVAGISIMVMLVPENYLYYAGMMLIFSAGYFFIKLRFFAASVAGWITLLIFNAGAIWYSHAPTIILINANFFFISANIIGMFAAYNIEYYARRNFFLNQELEQEKLRVEYANKNLEKTVAKRTNELTLAKETAETNNANISAIIEGTQSNIWAFNQKYEILYINQVFQKEFQQTFGVLLEPGVNLVEALPEVLRPLWKPRYDKVLHNEQFTIEDAIDSEHGTIFVQVTFNPIVKKGEVVGGSCFGTNITDRKLSELELISAKEKAEESDRLKSAFLANMSHEIRTPMNGILGFAELLKNTELSGDQQHEFLDIIEKSGHRMLNIINDIVDISKIEAGVMPVEIKALDTHAMMEYIYAFFKPEVEAKSMNFSIKNTVPHDESVIYTDPEKAYAILTNLVKNAIKYSQKGFIEFSVTKKGNFLEFYVKDSGIGIPRDRLDTVFERFIQVDTDSNITKQGAGLGLSISKAYIEMLGGKIWLESTLGNGSTFYFTLPYKTEPIK